MLFIFIYLFIFFTSIVDLGPSGGFIPELAEVCLAAVNAFSMPCAINMYITNYGQKTSAPPHTDKQVHGLSDTLSMSTYVRTHVQTDTHTHTHTHTLTHTHTYTHTHTH